MTAETDRAMAQELGRLTGRIEGLPCRDHQTALADVRKAINDLPEKVADVVAQTVAAEVAKALKNRKSPSRWTPAAVVAAIGAFIEGMRHFSEK